MWRALVILLALAGFDHVKHAAQSKDALVCADCHAKPATKPGHAQCFGKCHGAAPKLPPRGKPLAVEPMCATCHTQAALATPTRQALAVRVPSPPDFALVVGHKRHAAVACATCHPAQKSSPDKMIVHARCSGCHIGTKGPPMALCTSCHVADDAPALPESRPLVGSAFSHPKHAARGAKCATCHATATETDARELPHATKPTCSVAGCHDGKAAFATTDSCTRCHQDVPTGKYDVARPTSPFSHTRHLAFTALVGCATCHAVSRTGEVGLAGHAQCTPCHADDYAARFPATCGACHDATEPWRKLVPDRPSLQTSEFGASLDHAKHRAACTSCHTLTTATAQLRPPRGHAACTGNGCHAASGAPEPAFTDCNGCHALGLAAGRDAQRAAARWSVRTTFTHAKHERAPDGSALACVSCHLDVSGRDLLALATPPKVACIPCHDGQTSFKVTGTGCARCHPTKR